MDLTDLKECVEVLELMASSTSRERRIAEVERLTDEYVSHTGRVPDESLLLRMANVLLHEELTDNDKDKMRNNEYPILSESQYARRTEGRHGGTPRKDGLRLREVPLTQARNIGADGKNYNEPKRYM